MQRRPTQPTVIDAVTKMMHGSTNATVGLERLRPILKSGPVTLLLHIFDLAPGTVEPEFIKIDGA